MWLVGWCLSVAGFEFDRRDAQPVTEIERGWVKRLVCGSRPEVKLIAAASTVKAAEEIAREVNREAACCLRTAGRPAAQRTRATPLWSAAKGGLPVQELKHAANRNLRANRRIIEPAHEAWSVELLVLADRFFPFCLAFCSAR